MAGYIKRDDVLAKKRTYLDIRYGTGSRTLVDVPAVLVSDIEDIPDEDVRPVVHCRECIYDGNCFAQSIFEEMSRIPFDKNRFFCADGKRREGGDDE